MDYISFLELKTEYSKDREGVKGLLHYDDCERLWKDIPWAMKELVAIYRETVKGFQLISYKLYALENNGKTEEYNAVDISELAVEAKTLDAKALEEVTALYEKVVGVRERKAMELSAEIKELQSKQKMCLEALHRRNIQEKQEEKQVRV